MSLFRSASGPGGLSINTGAANSLAPPASQPAASGGLFGSSSATANNTTGASTTAPAMASSAGGLFGGGAQKTGGGLFGASTTTASAPATGGGLFGSSTAQQTPKPSGGLFGNTQQNTATGTSTTTGGGLFGNAGNAGQQQQQQQSGTTGGLFGQTQNQQQPQQQSTGGGLFGGGASTTTAQTSSAGGLFGQSQSKSTGGLFGQTQPQQMQQQNAGQVSAVQVNYDNLRPRSRFDDLAQPVQDEIALIDKGIQRVIKMKDEIGEFMPQHERDIQQLGQDVKFVESKFRSVQVALHRDVQTVKTLQDMTKKNIADAQLSFKAADNLKLPTHYHTTGLFATTPSGGPSGDAGSSGGGAGGASSASATHASAQDLITYFNRVCDNVEKYKRRLDEYRSDIERDMPGVEHGLYEQIRAFRDRNASAAAAAASGGVQDQLGEVLSALRELEAFEAAGWDHRQWGVCGWRDGMRDDVRSDIADIGV
ncbi:nucleoporin FG repeat region domain-containing protein [Sarocladium implicatum]|nr:nucleoporin FG repeat region domain-containing protein [Sarocladium implicatum]